MTGSPNGFRIFTGFISEINSKYGGTETTGVQLMSYGYDLDQYILNNAGNTTVTFNSYDPSTIVTEVLDKFTIDGGGDTFTTYLPSTVKTTGSVVSYRFVANTYAEVLKKSIELAPSNWYYYVDLGTNYVNFREKSAIPQHYFYLGKHIKTLDLRSYIGEVVNEVLFVGGGDPALFKRYTEAVLPNTRRGLSRLYDNRVTIVESADILSEGEIEQRSPVQYRTTVSILDKTYDIESINLGEVITFRNFDNYVDLISMQIVGKEYTPDEVVLQLNTLPLNVNKRLEDLKRNLNLQENEYLPTSPI